MDEAEATSVQRLPRKLRGQSRSGPAYGTDGEPASPTVYRISDQTMADMGEMYTDLMGPSGLQPALKQRGRRRKAEFPHHPSPGCRATSPAGPYRLALPVSPVPTKSGNDSKYAASLEVNAPESP